MPGAKPRLRQAKPRIVSFRCVLRNRLGEVISSSFNQEVLTGGKAPSAATIPALFKGLEGVRKGERRQLNVSAEQAYGFYDDKLVIEVPRKKFPQGSIEVGNSVLADSGDGNRLLYRIVGITPTHVKLDGNHPLAGQDLIFDIEATEVRDATPEEIRGAAPGPSGSEGRGSGAGSAPASDRSSGARPGARGYLH